MGEAGAHFNWDRFFKTFAKAKGILLDSYSDAYGGSGHHFDWDLIPQNLCLPIVLGGGLTVDNVTHAMQTLKNKNINFALDVSSGVEASKGIKDAEKMAQFIKQVQKVDLDTDTKWKNWEVFAFYQYSSTIGINVFYLPIKALNL